ncbi:hypothetical protein H2202_001247 [Exophiala xenobiotica]|nr:hypothetical protein H2202_001247 [Exophiala xenobiotica]KAK5234046.1 hypothetical protein LTR47_004635 [Exophiala xenobiotica]KAK5243172.1 hypothetical protein LTS06_011004 [Exophiala xenobiotica]KAK5281914.1 hypothetical protein LTR40_004098 [Exophiala xenobiotica]KAK5325011.1 hypothetical protein LTR93_004486 [Exophiala xenobiotica]
MDDDMELKKNGSPHSATEQTVSIQQAPIQQAPNVEKRFRLWSTLALQCSISATPLAIGTYLATDIGIGGSPVYFFGYVLCGIMNVVICASLSEIAAVLPHPTGQIYWAAVLYPPKYARGVSYLLGWLTCGAWFCAAAATYLFTAQLTMALVSVIRTNFVALPWHVYMAYIGVAAFAFCLNLPLFKLYPYLLNGLVPFINIGTIFVMIGLLVRAHPKQSASFVFADFVNDTGWKSDGVVFFLGLLPGVGATIGFDAATHMTEELPDAKRQVPRIIMYSVLINVLVGLPMTLVYSFCTVSPENLLTPIGGQPIIQILLDGMDSLALTIIGSLIFLITFMFGATTVSTVFSRTWWSFAQAGGVPFSGFFAKINARLHLPVNSIVLGTLGGMAIGAIEIGSTTALNAIAGATVATFYASYTIPIVGLLINRRAIFAQTRYFNMGKWGLVVNVIAVAWMSMMFVWVCVPLYLPVELITMNWSSVVVVGVLFIGVVNWVVIGRKTFTNPAMVTDGVQLHTV